MGYLLDANVFIQANNLHYGLDFCPAFWDWLIAENEAGNVFSIERWVMKFRRAAMISRSGLHDAA